MAKWLALRRYADTYVCSDCQRSDLNPSILYTNALGLSQCPLATCFGRPICPDCNTRIRPVRQHSGGGGCIRHTRTALYYNCECSSGCVGLSAKGLPSNAAAPAPAHTRPAAAPPQPSMRPTSTAPAVAGRPWIPGQPTTPSPPPPDPYSGDRLRKRQQLSIKIIERLREAMSSALILGHDVPTLAVLDLDNTNDFKIVCSTCGGYVNVSVKEFPDIDYIGTAVAFACKKLMRKP